MKHIAQIYYIVANENMQMDQAKLKKLVKILSQVSQYFDSTVCKQVSLRYDSELRSFVLAMRSCRQPRLRSARFDVLSFARRRH